MTDGLNEKTHPPIYEPADLARGAAAWRALKAGLKSPASFIATPETSEEAAPGSGDIGIERMWNTLVWCAVVPVLAVNAVLAMMSVMFSFVRFSDEQPMAILAATPMWLGFALIAGWLGGHVLRGGLRHGGAATKGDTSALNDIGWAMSAGAFVMPIWVLGFAPSLLELVHRMGVPLNVVELLMLIFFIAGAALALRHIFLCLWAYLKEQGETSLTPLVLGGGGFALVWFVIGVIPMLFALVLMIDKFD